MGRTFGKQAQDLLKSYEERISHLERTVRALAHLQGIAFDDIRLPDEELVFLYQSLQNFCEMKRWPREKEEDIADIFYKLQYADLLRINRLTKDETPWYPFLLLACYMFSDLKHLVLSTHIRAGIKNLQGHALLWERAHGRSCPQLYAFDAPTARNFKRVAALLSSAVKPPRRK